ncbi:50S ribosomal protein L32 [Desulfolucanica intricata]|uniref:50S ribosomal protein L32 n=1 Tax=Desulfolucanica intricata TaxID=1285191 RepID=UPI00082EB158|nr:50S ribosomal protein L32 [Desulfolucanica intricata]
MGVQQNRTSKQRKRSRRAQQKLTAPGYVKCPQCHEPVKPHYVCSECGFYDAKKVVK